MEKFVNSVGAYLQDKKALQEDDIDVFTYGLDLVIFSIVSILGLLVLGFVVGHFLETVFYLLAFTPLQTTGGGYHAKTHLRCFLITLAGWLAAMILCHILPLWIIALFMLQGILTVFKYAPIEHVNAPMSPRQRRKMRRYARTICVAMFVCVCTAYTFGSTLLIPVAAGIGMYGISANVAYRMKTNTRNKALHYDIE